MATAAGRVKWLSDLEKAVILSNFEKRGWVKGSSEGMYIMCSKTTTTRTCRGLCCWVYPFMCSFVHSHQHVLLTLINKRFGCPHQCTRTQNRQTNLYKTSRKIATVQQFKNWVGTWCARTSIAWRVCATSRSYTGGSMPQL